MKKLRDLKRIYNLQNKGRNKNRLNGKEKANFPLFRKN